MELLQRYKNFIQQNDLFSPKDKLLLAVSGGVDSVVLCELCYQAGYDFVIAHCNFQLRGEESERDEEFVKNLVEKYKVEVKVRKFDTKKFAEENKLSIQEAARELRYDWFAELVRSRESGVGSKNPAHHSPLTAHLLTAHHADDNIETLLMNFFRGTGLYGLSGIPVKSPYASVCRPLLSFWKKELLEFAQQNNLQFVEDSSNLSSKYTRNFFRNEIIPLIEQAYPQVKENLLDNIERFTGIRKLYTTAVDEVKKKLFKIKNGEIHIPIKQLMSYNSKALIYEIIVNFGFSEKQVEDVIKLTEAESGKFMQSPNALTPVRIIKFRHWLIISSSSLSESETIIIDEETKNLQLTIGNLQLEKHSTSGFILPTSDFIACLDAGEIQFPLILRKWKQGDYFYPLGMKKKKKLSRFFIDKKLSKTEKEKVWVIEMNKKILWVVGYRIDERFKVKGKTKSILKITLGHS